jgi:hypothetical protein
MRDGSSGTHDQPDGYDAQTLRTSVQTAILGAAVIPGPYGGPPLVEGVIPLLIDDALVFTLTYDRLETARLIGRAPELTLVLHDPRLARVGWSPLAAPVRATVEPDPEGDIFSEEMLEQELRKHPPSREIANTFLLQRENWWYLPRLIVRLEPVEAPRPLARREDSSHGLLAWSEALGGYPGAQTVAAPDTAGDYLPISPLGPDNLPDDAPATLRMHDLEIPEMESSTAFNAFGRLRGGRLQVETRSGSAELGPRPGIISRWRWLRSLEKGCKRGLKAGY